MTWCRGRRRGVSAALPRSNARSASHRFTDSARTRLRRTSRPTPNAPSNVIPAQTVAGSVTIRTSRPVKLSAVDSSSYRLAFRTPASTLCQAPQSGAPVIDCGGAGGGVIGRCGVVVCWGDRPSAAGGGIGAGSAPAAIVDPARATDPQHTAMAMAPATSACLPRPHIPHSP